MAITAAGTGSGIDIEGLVSQLVAAEAEPTNSRFNRRETRLEAELSALGTLKSALSTFLDSASELQDLDTFQAYSATSSNESLFTVNADSTAVPGSYAIEVQQLASAEKARSAFFAASDEVMGTGTLDISLGSDSFQLTIDGTNNTLTGIRDAINGAESNPGITASLINVDAGTQLILTSNDVGASNTIAVTAIDGDGSDGFDLMRLDSANLTVESGLDAIIKVDSQTVTRNSNSFSDVIAGVTFNLAKAEPGTIETLTVATDQQEIIGDIKKFVDNFNALSGVMEGLSNFDAETGVAGALNGDSVIRGIQSRLRDTLFAGATGGVFANLSELGITLDDTGNLNVDDAELADKVSTNLVAVRDFFASETGVGQNFTSALAGYEDNNGILESRQDSVQSRLDRIDDDRDTLARRMDSLESRLRAQFTAMDILVAQLQSTGNFLTSQLASLPRPNSLNNN